MVLIGIDYGTTFSTLCITTGESTTLYKRDGSEFVPSLIGYNRGLVNFGYGVLNRDGTDNYEYDVYRDMKRWVGVDSTNVEEKKSVLKPTYEVYAYEDVMDFKLGCANNPRAQVRLLRDLISRFILVCVNDFENVRKFKCTGLIVSVPAKYSTIQRLFMKSLESLIGLPILHIMNEPSAALFASVYDRIPAKPAEYYIVYDFGGGTFDVSVVGRIGKKYAVLFSNGDEQLGGRDIDRALLNDIKRINNIQGDLNFSLSLFKEEICLTETTVVRHQDGKRITYTYDQLRELVSPFLDKANKIMIDTYKYSKIDRKVWIVPIGGSSALPGAIESNRSAMARDTYGVIVAKRNRSAVAEGCSLFSATLSDPDSLFVDCVTSNITSSKGYYASNVIIPAGAPLPVTVKWSISSYAPNLFWVVGIFEGNSNRTFKNKRLAKFKVSKETFGLNDHHFTWYVEARMNPLGIIDIECGCNKSNKTIKQSLGQRNFDKLPYMKVVGRSDDAINDTLTPMAICDFRTAVLHKKLYENGEFLDYFEYLKSLKVPRFRNKISTRANIYSQHSSVFNGSGDYKSFLSLRGPVPKFLRDVGYYEVSRSGDQHRLQ